MWRPARPNSDKKRLRMTTKQMAVIQRKLWRIRHRIESASKEDLKATAKGEWNAEGPGKEFDDFFWKWYHEVGRRELLDLEKKDKGRGFTVFFPTSSYYFSVDWIRFTPSRRITHEACRYGNPEKTAVQKLTHGNPAAEYAAMKPDGQFYELSPAWCEKFKLDCAKRRRANFPAWAKATA